MQCEQDQIKKQMETTLCDSIEEKKNTAINSTSSFESFKKRGNIKQSTDIFLINKNQTRAAHSLIASRGIQMPMSIDHFSIYTY